MNAAAILLLDQIKKEREAAEEERIRRNSRPFYPHPFAWCSGIEPSYYSSGAYGMGQYLTSSSSQVFDDLGVVSNASVKLPEVQSEITYEEPLTKRKPINFKALFKKLKWVGVGLGITLIGWLILLVWSFYA